MKEYIVHAPKTKLTAVEEYTSFYGEPVEELIRCKDCKYWQFYDLVKANVCKRRYNGHWWESHEDDFCSRAERKE